MRTLLIGTAVGGLWISGLAGCVTVPQADLEEAKGQIKAVHRSQWEAARITALQERLTGAILMHDNVRDCRVGLGDDSLHLNGSGTRSLRLVVWLRCDQPTGSLFGPRLGLRTTVRTAVRKMGLRVDDLGAGQANGNEWVLQGRLWLRDKNL